MRIINDELMQEFRDAPCCEWCKTKTRGRLDPHHLWKRGQGGGWRLDVRLNLISLCRPCHGLAEEGIIARWCLLSLVAKREGILCSEEDMQELVWLIRRADKDADTLWFNQEARDLHAIEQFGSGALKLLERFLGEIRQSKRGSR